MSTRLRHFSDTVYTSRRKKKAVSIVTLVQNDTHRHTSAHINTSETKMLLQFSFYHGSKEKENFSLFYRYPLPNCMAYALPHNFITKCEVLRSVVYKMSCVTVC